MGQYRQRARHPRGACVVCGIDVALRLDGTPYRHYTPVRRADDPLYCTGSKQAAQDSRPAAPVGEVMWKHEDSLVNGARIGPCWVNKWNIGWIIDKQARLIAEACHYTYEET